jgi:integrase
MQLPEYGIRTKNRKAAITYLLEIPELLAVCKKWDDRVRHLDHKSLWYATLASDGMALTETVTAFLGRNNLIERDVRLICERAEVPYQSPHKLRHGHVVYAMKQARNMGELKAISQNIMHASAVVTDQVYGRLLTNDVQLIISNLGKASAPIVDINQIIELLQRRLKQPE